MTAPLLNAERLADEIALLVTITDASLAAPLRYTSSAAERLSVEPLVYGLRAGGHVYRYALREALLPDEGDDNAHETSITIDNVVEDAAPALRALSPDARVAIALVLVAQPEAPVIAMTGLRIVGRSYAAESVTLEVSRHGGGAGGADSAEPLSGERQTRRTAPGLFR